MEKPGKAIRFPGNFVHQHSGRQGKHREAEKTGDRQ